MSADQSDTGDSGEQTFGGTVTSIMGACTGIGLLLTLLSAGDVGGPDFTLLWGGMVLGFGVSLLYLLTKIANGVHQRDAGH